MRCTHNCGAAAIVVQPSRLYGAGETPAPQMAPLHHKRYACTTNGAQEQSPLRFQAPGRVYTGRLKVRCNLLGPQCAIVYGNLIDPSDEVGKAVVSPADEDLSAALGGISDSHAAGKLGLFPAIEVDMDFLTLADQNHVVPRSFGDSHG